MMFSARFEHSNPFIEATTLFFGVYFFFSPEMWRALPNRSSHLFRNAEVRINFRDFVNEYRYILEITSIVWPPKAAQIFGDIYT